MIDTGNPRVGDGDDSLHEETLRIVLEDGEGNRKSGSSTPASMKRENQCMKYIYPKSLNTSPDNPAKPSSGLPLDVEEARRKLSVPPQESHR